MTYRAVAAIAVTAIAAPAIAVAAVMILIMMVTVVMEAVVQLPRSIRNRNLIRKAVRQPLALSIRGVT